MPDDHQARLDEWRKFATEREYQRHQERFKKQFYAEQAHVEPRLVEPVDDDPMPDYESGSTEEA